MSKDQPLLQAENESPSSTRLSRADRAEALQDLAAALEGAPRPNRAARRAARRVTRRRGRTLALPPGRRAATPPRAP